jgi:uncharacterized protein YciI
MQFVVLARDSAHPGTLDKRMAARPAHLEVIHQMKADGSVLDGGALLDAEGKMVGSIILCEFPDRAALDAYIASEIYKRDEVWGDIQILPFRRVPWQA